MKFCEWLRHEHNAEELFLPNILWTYEACFKPEDEFNIHNSHLAARDNPHAIRERGYQVLFSVSAWTGIVADTVAGPYLLCLPDFLETSMGAV
jgi:hypothetical protein